MTSNETGRLQGKVALVIGGASGIGLAVVERFTAEGADVLFTGRRQSDVDAGAARSGAQPIRAGASRVDDLRAVVAAVSESRKRIDVLVLNAGTSVSHRIEDVTVEDFDLQIGLNVRSHARTLTAELAPRGIRVNTLSPPTRRCSTRYPTTCVRVWLPRYRSDDW